jgi:uncharacterized protein (DUF983 family)
MGSPLKQRNCNKRSGKYARTPATSFLSYLRQTQLNALARPLCPRCEKRRLIRAGDRLAGACTECQIKQESQ